MLLSENAPNVGGENECKFSICNTLEYNDKQKSLRCKNLFRKEEHFILDVKADTNSSAQEWIAAINGHIEYFYKSKFDELQVDDILAEEWLEKKNSWAKNKLGKNYIYIYIYIQCCSVKTPQTAIFKKNSI